MPITTWRVFCTACLRQSLPGRWGIWDCRGLKPRGFLVHRRSLPHEYGCSRCRGSFSPSVRYPSEEEKPVSECPPVRDGAWLARLTRDVGEKHLSVRRECASIGQDRLLR